MTHYCLDVCSIINLFCGWGGIQELHTFGDSWSTSGTALREFTAVRVQQSDGSIIKCPVQHDTLLDQYRLAVHSATGDAELATLAMLSSLVDDGEAECLAIAFHRGLTFVSDDGLAIIEATKLGVPWRSSIDLLIEWCGLDARRPQRLPEIVYRIQFLASYAPPKSSPHKAWWDALRSGS